MPDSVDELDLALINALQVSPRAPWSALGRALGVDAATVARRWRRLHDSGIAWITCVIGPARHREFCMAYLEVDCAPGRLDEVADTLVELDHVIYLYQLTGQYALFVVLARPTPAAIAESVRMSVAALPGVRGYRCELRTVGYSEASRWRLHSLTRAQRQMLETDAEPRHAAQGGRVDPTDQRIYQLLHEDGRMSYPELAGRAGISEPTARRRVNRLLTTRQLRLRCDVAQSVSGTPHTAVVWASVPPESLDRVGRSLATLPSVRLCCALTGARNLLLMVWLRTLDEMPALEATLVERAPGLVVADRAISLRTMKQLGRLLDGEGRSIREIPLSGETFFAS
ncbi:Lrp/AsnC family transcriptional regulator [Amycolatopsis taiwanensis]|uniref:AsnC family transcriptional regulator n=1 Tax=Amycolatopsis taiwanensis TaxID=342230 RepID=A0A9W6R7S4_9PSEU|nr:Lrp/AsnC family transcriptional regulator [Amycolatopsis taiwanensis]GLY70378.1 AsnC family transcriptional regulator [Amycolatopsis taiwanensis]